MRPSQVPLFVPVAEILVVCDVMSLQLCYTAFCVSLTCVRNLPCRVLLLRWTYTRPLRTECSGLKQTNLHIPWCNTAPPHQRRSMVECFIIYWKRGPGFGAWISLETMRSIFIISASVVKWSEFLTTERRCIVFPVRYELNLYMLCRRK
jgi:hypothetical protein